MIRVTIELLPFGSEIGRRNLGTIDIANSGSGTLERGNYKVRFAKTGHPASTWRDGVVIGFPRRSKGVYDLLLRALVGVVGSRNKRFIDELNEEVQGG